VVLPITVLEELDRFKKGHEALHFHAREFVRMLDKLSGDHVFNGGVPIGDNSGLLRIKLEQEFHADLALNFPEKTPDHRILNTAYWLAREEPDRPVILISKDVNLRLKAKSVGLVAEDYTTDHVTDVTELYTGRRIQEGIDEDVADRIYEDPHRVSPADIGINGDLKPNEFLILRSEQKSALATFASETGLLRRIDKRSVNRIAPRNAEQTFALDALLNPEVSLVTLMGKAGTGKTLLALAAGLDQQHHNYRQLCVARPVVPLNNRDIGYLPGDIDSKLDPYMQPLYDNLDFIQNQFTPSDRKHRRIQDSLATGKITVTALSYIRGRSLMETYFIVDEAQNLTPHEVKTIITRAGEGTKMVFTGDIFQIDHPYLDMHSNGLSYLIARMQGQPLYAHVMLEKGERSSLAELASDLL
jgi:PhoH-like ATPase